MNRSFRFLSGIRTHDKDNHLLLIGVVAVPVLLLLPVLVSGKAIFWGTPMMQFVPWWDLAWSQLRQGILPLWNPYNGMGAPLLANYQSALFYPPHWMYFLLHWIGGRALMAWGMALMICLHLAFAGTSMALLVRRLGLGNLSQAVAGLGFGMCGYLVARAGFLSINAAVAWMPWILLCLTPKAPSARIGGLQRLALVACLCMQLLAGHAQTTWYSWIMAGCWVSCLAWLRVFPRNALELRGQKIKSLMNGRIGQFWYASLLLVAGILPATALSAVQLLPTAEYWLFSQRSAAVDYELAMTYSFWPWRLLSLFAPDLYGNPARGDYWGYGNYWEDAIYIGLLPVLLALGALLPAVRRKPISNSHAMQHTAMRDLALSIQFRRFLLLLVAASLVMALGSNTPIFPWLYRSIPGFDLFQAPSRHLVWLEFALCLAAGLGVESWRQPENHRLYWTRLSTAGALAVVLGAGLAWYLLGEIRPTFIRSTALAGLWGIGAGLLSLSAPKTGELQSSPVSSKVKLWQWLVILWIAADLLVAGMGLNPAVDLEAYRTSSSAAEIRQRLDGKRLYIPPSQEYELKFESFLRFDSFKPAGRWQLLRTAILPNLNIYERINSVNNFDPLLPGIYATWMKEIEQLPVPVQEDFMRFMDVGLIQQTLNTNPESIQFLPVTGGKRARFVSCAISARNADEALKLTTGGEIDLENHTIIQGGENLPTTCNLSIAARGPQIIEQSPEKLVISLDTVQAGYLVVADLWYPGWKAWVNGKEVPILLANTIFRAVPVGLGGQQVIMRYRPLTFRLGGVASSVTLLALIIIWCKLVGVEIEGG